MMTDKVVVYNEDLYNRFLAECKAHFGLIHKGSWLIVRGYWSVGKTMLKYEADGRLEFSYGSGMMNAVAKDLGFRDATVPYRMREAAVRYPQEAALEQARDTILAAGLSPNWTNFRNMCLPKDTTHPDRYGGRENVFESRLGKIEGLLIEMEELDDMAKDADQEEQWRGVKEKAKEVLHDLVESSFPVGKDVSPQNEDYLGYIRSMACVICDATPCDPHHVETGGVGMKGSDYATVPLCRKHHDELHRRGRDQFEKWHGVELWWEVSKCLMKYVAMLAT